MLVYPVYLMENHEENPRKIQNQTISFRN